MSDASHAYKTVAYLFDPLCGWCYGALPMLARLRETGIAIEPIPTGLFCDAGARPMDKSFAAYAWSNDQRIARLTGQPFSEAYRSKVVEAADGLFDSGPATLALTAVSLIAPERELDALKAIQRARYVGGLDITALASLVTILQGAGFAAAVDRIMARGADLIAGNRARIDRGRQLMASFDAQGVPALILNGRNGTRLLGSNTLFGSFDNLVSHLRAA